MKIANIQLVFILCFLTGRENEIHAQVVDSFIITFTDSRIFIVDKNFALIKIYDKQSGELVRGINVEKAPRRISVDADGTRLFVADDRYAYYLDLHNNDAMHNRFELHPGGQVAAFGGSTMVEYDQVIKPAGLFRSGVLWYVDLTGVYVDGEPSSAKNIFYNIVTKTNADSLATMNEAFAIDNDSHDQADRHQIEMKVEAAQEPPADPELPDYPIKTEYKNNKEYKRAEEKYMADKEHYDNVLFPKWKKELDSYSKSVSTPKWTIKIRNKRTDEIVLALENMVGGLFIGSNLYLAWDDYTYSAYDLSANGELKYVIDRL